MNITELYTGIEQHLLEDDKPSVYLNEIYNSTLFSQYPFDMLHKLKSTEQSPKYHPEGNVWNHTMLVVNEAARLKSKSTNPTVLMWAALLHDIGKPQTTKKKNKKITSYDHEIVGKKLSEEFLSVFTQDKQFINEVAHLIYYHMQILFVVKNMSFADIPSMKQDTDINEIALLGLSDRLGRTNTNPAEEKSNIEIFLQKCK